MATPSSFVGRLATAYFDDRLSEQQLAALKRRIQWTCDCSQGRTLDIGCGPGIALIALAREGKPSVGIDVSRSAIDFANEQLANEGEPVRSVASFQCVELADFESDEPFETIVLADVLGQQADPALLFRTACKHLAQTGNIVLTTPLGHGIDKPQLSPIFPSWLLQFDDLPIEAAHLDVVDGNLRAHLRWNADAKSANLPSAFKLLQLTEGAVADLQQQTQALPSAPVVTAHGGKPTVAADISADYDAHSAHSTQSPTAGDTSIPGQASFNELLGSGRRLVRHAIAMRKKTDRVRLEAARLRASKSYALGHEIVTTKGLRFLTLPARLIGVLRKQRKKQPPTLPTQTRYRYVEIRGNSFLNAAQKTWITATSTPAKHYVFECFVTCFDEEVERGAVLEVRIEDKEGNLLEFSTDYLEHRKDGSAYTYVAAGPSIHLKIPIVTPAGTEQVRFGFSQYGSATPVFIHVGSWAAQSADAGPIAASGVSAPHSLPASEVDTDTDPTKPQVIAILDEFSTECLRPEFNLLPVSKSVWQDELSNQEPVALITESAWRGNNGQWRYVFNKPDRWGEELEKLLAYCRERALPTVFWNKEDPVHFDTFAAVAKRFDYIFTTDAACIERYNALTGKNNAHVLPFAAQARLHNPIRTAPPIHKFAFTGSWRGVKYPERARWLDILLEPLIERNALDIFDRFAGETKNPDLIFPDNLITAVRGGMDYRALVTEVYKRYLAFINVNSVESSDTMLARRVFELLACGAPVVSSPSPAIEKTFGGLVLTPRTQQEVSDVADRLLNDWHYRESLSTRGVRLVHSAHTYRHRVEYISQITGITSDARPQEMVSIICVSKRKNYLEHVAEQIGRQTYANFEIIYVAHTGENWGENWSEEVNKHLAHIANLTILHVGPDSVLADGLNAAMQVGKGNYFAKFDDDDYYGADYLTDAMLAFTYAPGAGVVGKRSFFAFMEAQDKTVLRFKGSAYTYTNRVHGGTLVWNRERTTGITFERVKAGTDSLFLKACESRNIRIFSSDPFNYVHVRHQNLAHHTWQIDDEEFLKRTELIDQGLALNKVFV